MRSWIKLVTKRINYYPSQNHEIYFMVLKVNNLKYHIGVKTKKGLVPVLANSRKCVVKPMLKKQKINAQVRKFLIGSTK